MTTAVARSATSRPRLRLARPSGETGLVLFLFLLGTVLCLVRQPGVPSWDSIWQEDGAVFLSHAWKDPFLGTIGQVYNSYLHVLPRFLAGIVALFPLRVSAIGLSLAASMVIAGLGVYVYYASASVFENRWARALMGVMVVLLPAGGYETNANIANLHWYLIYGAFWVLVAKPRTRGGIVLGSAICGFATLSDPLAGLILPLVLRRLWEARRDPPGRVVPVVFLITLAIQVAAGYFQTPTGRYASSHWGDLPGVYALRIAGSTVVGDNLLSRFWNPLGYVFAYASLAVVLAILAYGISKTDRARRLFIGESLFYSVLTLCVPLMLRGTENFLNRGTNPAHPFSLNGSRYTTLPALLLAGALIQVFDQRDARISRAGWNRIAIGFCAVMLGIVASSFDVVTVRTNGPSWKSQLAWARRQCRTKPTELSTLPYNALPSAPGLPATPSSDIRIPISPAIPDVSQPFAVTLRCKDLR